MAYFFQQGSRYSVDIANSVYTSYEVINGIYVFTVEQSRRFFLKLNGNVGSGTPDLYENGQKLPFSPVGTISVASNSVGIQSVSPGDEGTYTIQSSNGDELTFRLKVIATDAYRQRRHEDTRDPSWW